MIAASTAKVKMVSVDLVSVCLPARNEGATVGTIVEAVVVLDEVDEVVVVDDGSTDGTAAVAEAAGATVVTCDGSGKGAALWTGVQAAKGDVLVFCDADLEDFDPGLVPRLLAPLHGDNRIAFVKGRYQHDGESGRVTELVARPLIDLLFPHLAGFGSPLAGEFAARRSVLEPLVFAPGDGVDLALLIDVVALVGLERTAQVDLGVKRHRHRRLSELRVQAREVLEAALARL